MKIKTAPFFPASDLSECSAPSASGSLKSSITVPMAGGAGRSLVLPLPATAAKAMTIIEARNIGNAKCFFILFTPLNDGWRVTGKISSRKLDVASDEIVRAGAFGHLVRTSQRTPKTSAAKSFIGSRVPSTVPDAESGRNFQWHGAHRTATCRGR